MVCLALDLCHLMIPDSKVWTTSNQPTMSMKTAELDLPEILVNAIKAFNFTESPLWTISKGQDHVKVELTFQLPTVSQPIARKNKVLSKRAISRTKPTITPCQRLPAKTPPTRQPTTATIPTPPSATIHRPVTTTASPTPPARKLPRLISPESSPVKTDKPRRESIKIISFDQFSINLPDIEEGNYTMLPSATDVKTFDVYDVEAVRTLRGANHYLLKRKMPFNVESPTNDEIYATYDETNHLAILVMPPVAADYHHPEVWREWKTTFSRAEPVTDAPQSIDMLANTSFWMIVPRSVTGNYKGDNNGCDELL